MLGTYIKHNSQVHNTTFYFIIHPLLYTKRSRLSLPRLTPSNSFPITPVIAELLRSIGITIHTCYMYKYNIIVSTKFHLISDSDKTELNEKTASVQWHYGSASDRK